SPHRKVQDSHDFVHPRCQCLPCIIKSAAAADDDDDDPSLSYDQRILRAGPLIGPALPVRSWNIVVRLHFASMIFTGKQEGIRWPSPRGVGPSNRSCYLLNYSEKTDIYFIDVSTTFV